MPGSGTVPQVAYFYELDDKGKAVHGSKQSARKDKDKVKVSQRESRPGKSSRKSHSEGGVVAKFDEAISPGTKNASSSKSPKKPTRPPSVHESRGFTKGSIPRKDDPSHFGIPTSTSRAPPVVSQQPQPMAIPLRPRAVTAQTYPLRPLSYHSAYTSGGHATGPPLSASAFYQPPMASPSYPPPYRYGTQADYFSATPRTLDQRFTPLQQTIDPIQRTASAWGGRDTVPLQRTIDPIQQTASAWGGRDTVPLQRTIDPIQRTASAWGGRDTEPQTYTSYDDDGYRSASEGPETRRASIRVPSARSKAEIDYDAMPPPARPGILRRPATEYYADSVPDPPSRRDSRSVYRDHRDDGPPAVRRPSLRRNSVSYDLPDSDRVRIYETANKGRRRASYYGPSNDSVDSRDYDDKVRQAQTYQEDVAGPEPLPLTADMLKRQQRRQNQAGSSRSTKSSGSRDESDYRKSATTRTTRSGSGGDDENVTIRVIGTARVMVGGAQIDCADGGEIEIKRQKAIRNGSERGSEFGGTQRDRDRDRIEDQRSRVDRPTGRSRMSSRSNQSYTRTTPQWI